MKEKLIPNRQSRFLMCARKVGEAGFNSDTAIRISRLVPDLFLLHAVFVDAKSLKLEIVDNYRVFLHYAEYEPLYLGSFSKHGYTRARAFWNTDELTLFGITLQEAAEYDLDLAFSKYDRSKWQVEFAHQQSATLSTFISIAECLREFTEGAQ